MCMDGWSSGYVTDVAYSYGFYRELNPSIMELARSADDLQWLASPITGGGVMVDRFSRLFLLAARVGHDDPPAYVWDQLKATGVKLQKNDTPLESDEENPQELRVIFDNHTSQQLPILRTLGIA